MPQYVQVTIAFCQIEDRENMRAWNNSAISITDIGRRKKNIGCL